MDQPTVSQFTSYFQFRQINLNDLAQELFGVAPSTARRFSLMKPIGQMGKMFIFSFGAVTFLNVDESERLKELHELSKLGLLRPEASVRPIVESFQVVENKDEKPRVEFSQMYIDVLTESREQVIAGLVGQSAAMDHFEDVVDRIWTKVDQFLVKLQDTGSISRTATQMHRDVAEAIRMRSDVVRILHLLDRPELIWEDKLMDSLFDDLRSTFELQERFQALAYKLSLIQETMELLVDTARDRRMYRVEIAIVVLILIEVVIVLVEKAHVFIKYIL